jgi:metal-responsive CopG/Arc/MetJ family transcriptional regulator
MAATTKTAVSLPSALLERCNELAERRHVSRSALVAEALESLLRRYEAEELTRRFDEVYADPAAGEPLPRGMERQLGRIVKGKW